MPSENDEIVGAVSNVSAQPAAKKIRKKHADIRRKKALKLLRLRGNEEVLNSNDQNKETIYRKSARITVKKDKWQI